jgi:hypothetical protein
VAGLQGHGRGAYGNVPLQPGHDGDGVFPEDRTLNGIDRRHLSLGNPRQATGEVSGRLAIHDIQQAPRGFAGRLLCADLVGLQIALTRCNEGCAPIAHIELRVRRALQHHALTLNLDLPGMTRAARKRDNQRLQGRIVDFSGGQSLPIHWAARNTRYAKSARQNAVRMVWVAEKTEIGKEPVFRSPDLRCQIRQRLQQYQRYACEAVARIGEPGKADGIRSLHRFDPVGTGGLDLCPGRWAAGVLKRMLKSVACRAYLGAAFGISRSSDYTNHGKYRES